MLGNLQRHQEVVEVLKPLTDRVENDDKFKQQLNMLNFYYSRVRSDVDYHGALAMIEKGNLDEAQTETGESVSGLPSKHRYSDFDVSAGRRRGLERDGSGHVEKDDSPS